MTDGVKVVVGPEDTYPIRFWVSKEGDDLVVQPKKLAKKGQVEVWFKLKVPSQKMDIEMRKACMVRDSDSQILRLDYDKLQMERVRRLLVAWNLNEQDKDLLLHRVKEMVTDESLSILYDRIHHVIIRAFLRRLMEYMES